MNIRNRIKEYREVLPSEVAPNPRNWRLHPDAQREALRGVLADVGIAAPVIAYHSEAHGGLMLIDGHERMTVGVPFPAVILDVSDEEAATLLATFDPLGAMAQTDSAALDALLRDVSTDSPAVAAMLDALAQEAGLVPGVEAVDDPPADVPQDGPTRVQPGEVWRVGRHLVACLDSTDAEAVRRLVAGRRVGRRVGMVWADPPYGVRAVEESNRLRELGYKPVANDGDTGVARRAVALYLPMTPVQIWWGANYYADALPPSKSWIVWDKDHHGMDFADAELAWTSLNQPVRCFRHAWSGADRDSEKGQERIHPTQKPIALCAWAFEKYGAPDDLILDPFLGSGPSLKAAEGMGRTVVGFELSPYYCDHILAWAEGQGLTVERAP